MLLKKWFYDLRLITKICIIVQALVLVVFVCQVFVLSQIGMRSIRNERYRSASDSVAHANLLIQKEEVYLMGLASNCAISAEVQEALQESNRGNNSAALLNDVLSATQYGMSALNLIFYNLDGVVIDYMSIDASFNPINQNPTDLSRPFGRLINKRNGLNYEWEFIPQHAMDLFEQDNSPKVTLWYLVKDNSSKQSLGVIALSLDSRKLLTAQSEVGTSFDSLVIIHNDGSLVDGRGEILNTLSAEDLVALVAATPDDLTEGGFNISLQGGDYYCGYEKSAIQDCFIYSLVLDDVEITGNDFIYTSILGIGSCVLLSIPLSAIGAKFITRPVNMLMQAMSRYAAGERSVEISFRGGDEIGQLGRMFNSMVQKNNKLLEEKYELTIHKQEAELVALHTQIDPHFIYNMLNLIQWTALEKEDIEIATLTHSAAAVIRYSLNRKDRFVTVQQEMDLVNRYLDVQKRVLRNRLTIQCDVDHAAQGSYIPKLIIQPIIENSIKHGLRDDGSPLNIIVKISLCQGEKNLRIWIVDNGKGIEENVLRYLPERGDEVEKKALIKDGNQYALKNIFQRLQIYYGVGAYSFIIESKENMGTETTIIIPNKKINPEAQTE